MFHDHTLDIYIGLLFVQIGALQAQNESFCTVSIVTVLCSRFCIHLDTLKLDGVKENKAEQTCSAGDTSDQLQQEGYKTLWEVALCCAHLPPIARPNSITIWEGWPMSHVFCESLSPFHLFA